MNGMPSASRKRRLLRQLVPFVLAVLLVFYVLRRVDWAKFGESLAAVNHLAFFGMMVAFMLSLLSADVLATVYVYRRVVAPIRFVDLFTVRAASYLPSLINHHVGQAWVTYLVSRVYRAPLKHAIGATLVVYATWSGCILLLGMVALVASGVQLLWLAVPLFLGLSYLVLLELRPAWLTRYAMLSPLFQVGAWGHVQAMVMRLPHVIVLFFGTWLPFSFFGVEIPFSVALARIPILVLAVTLPITPLGIGTRDVLAVEFFRNHVTGVSSPEAQVAVLAASTATVAVTILLIDAVIGLLSLRFALRLIPSPPSDPRGNPDPNREPGRERGLT